MCDQQEVAATQESQLVPQRGPTPALVMPSYWTIVTPIDDMVLTAQTAMEVSAAFPYTRGRCQEPIGERVIVNDLYGIPLYKPAVGHFDPDLGTGAIAAKEILAKTGADPNFVFDQANRNPEKASAYEMMYQTRSRTHAVRLQDGG